jgi:radical SAM protein with 4Fe4S-binding SPASM domain
VGLSAPFSVQLELTTRCNFHCIHCYATGNGAERKDIARSELNTEEVLRLLDEISEMGVWWLAITGGEPLLRRDIFEIARYAKSKGLIQVLMTNGSLISPRMAKDISRYFRGVQVSIDAADNETFRRIRGGGKDSFQQTLCGVRNLVSYGLRPKIAVTVMKQNVDQLDQIVELILSMGCSKISFGVVHPVSRVDRNWEKVMVDPYMAVSRIGEVVEAYQERIESGFSGTANLVSWFEECLRAAEYRINFCGAGTWQCSVDHCGNVRPCSILVNEDFSAGNVCEHSFSEIWLDKDTFPYFRDFQGNLEKIPMCSKCAFKLACGGRCRALAFACGGTFISNPPWCPIIHLDKYPPKHERSCEIEISKKGR